MGNMENIEKQEKYWLAFYTKPRHEFVAETEINALDIEVFLPKITVLKQWSDRKKKVTEPLFKSYIFARCNEKDRLRVLQLKSIVTNVRFQGKPSHVPDWEIYGIKKMLEAKVDVKVTEGLREGALVMITEGPFSGVKGIISDAQRGKKEIAISIEMLNRTVIATVPVSEIKILKAG
jgi:transcription antitermination factor NusG